MFAAALLLMLQTAPVQPPVMTLGAEIRLDCAVRAPGATAPFRLVARILAEDPAVKPASDQRSRTIEISDGPKGTIGSHRYGWDAFPGSHHKVQIDNYDARETYEIAFDLSDYGGGADGVVILRSSPTISGVVGVGYCRRDGGTAG
jgi:hypothetical protein